MRNRRHQEGQGRNVVGLDELAHLREGQRDLARPFVVVLVPVKFGQMEGRHIRIVVLVRLVRLAQLDKAVLVLLGRVVGFERADRAVVLDRLAAQLEIIIQHALDKFVEAPAVAHAVLVLHVDRLSLVATGEQIAVGIG